MHGDHEYYSERAATERRLGAEAADPKSAAAHLELAEHYERLLSEQPAPRPTLRIRTP